MQTGSTSTPVASVHARVMELLFVTGDQVKLNVAQIATILALDPAVVEAEVSTNQFVRYDAKRKVVALRKENPKAAPPRSGRRGGGSGATLDEGAEATDSGEDEDASRERRLPGEAQREQCSTKSSSSRSRVPSPSSPAKEGGGRGAAERLPATGARSVSAQARLRSGREEDPQWKSQQRQSSKAATRRRKAPVSRIGSLHPPPHSYPMSLGLTPLAEDRRRSSEDRLLFSSPHDTAGADGGGAPLVSLLSGRVGYVCVAEEFKLSDMQSYYSNLGYFTKFDLGVLHVRLPDRDGFPNEPSTKRKGGEPSQDTCSPAGSNSGGAEDYASPTTSLFIRRQRSNFDLFLFEYGAVVWWGADQRFFKLVETDFLLPDSGAAPFMVNRYPTQLVTENYPVWCSYSLVKKESLDVDDDFKKKLRFDHFLIPFGRQGEDAALCGTTMLCCAHALAQSAKIDYLELKVQELTEACAPLPRELRLKGHARITERRLLQLRGEVLSYRLMLNSGSDLLDEPDFFWENAYLKPIFEATKEGFGVDDRVEALDNKLDAANEILSMLADEFSQRHGARLEWIVIWLVFVEVIIGVLELAVDFKPWFYRN